MGSAEIGDYWVEVEIAKMDFWDRLIFRCCLGLGEGHFVGFHRAARLMELAYTRHLLQPGALSPLSRILLLPGVFPSVDPVLPTASQAASLQDGVEVALYRAFLQDLDLWSVVPSRPDQGPAWWTQITLDERRFLGVCHDLVPERRCLLFLSLYGQLPLRTITLIVRGTIGPNRSTDDVLLDLSAAWQRVFTLM